MATRRCLQVSELIDLITSSAADSLRTRRFSKGFGEAELQN
jgi:hypothetical protein